MALSTNSFIVQRGCVDAEAVGAVSSSSCRQSVKCFSACGLAPYYGYLRFNFNSSRTSQHQDFVGLAVGSALVVARKGVGVSSARSACRRPVYFYEVEEAFSYMAFILRRRVEAAAFFRP
eukprot:TRINITY_DN14591_c0_g2_i2.p1 TRINITY_DN14591_c0_g2~~TRINITY_DN14591_c0_g2_i2.p1  ORF type:complete len:120 (-),score=5.77 TRINITY_DN14591_c0_g2_i2:325-684(-)